MNAILVYLLYIYKYVYVLWTLLCFLCVVYEERMWAKIIIIIVGVLVQLWIPKYSGTEQCHPLNNSQTIHFLNLPYQWQGKISKFTWKLLWSEQLNLFSTLYWLASITNNIPSLHIYYLLRWKITDIENEQTHFLRFIFFYCSLQQQKQAPLWWLHAMAIFQMAMLKPKGPTLTLQIYLLFCKAHYYHTIIFDLFSVFLFFSNIVIIIITFNNNSLITRLLARR